MSDKKNEYINSEMIYKKDNEMRGNKEISLIKMIYKQKERKALKGEKIETFNEKLGFLFKDRNQDSLRILGKYFVNKNKNKSKLIYNNKKYELKELLKDIDNNYAGKDIIKLKIIGINFITYISRIFNGCFYLSEVSEYQEWNTNYNINDSSNCISEKNLKQNLKISLKMKKNI